MNERSITEAQEDLYQRTLADAFLSEVAVINAYKGDIQTEILNALGVLNERGGKIGACIVVQEPMANDSGAEVAGGLLSVEFSFLVLEDPVINQGANGTGLRAWTIARRLFGIHYLYHGVGSLGVLTGRRPKAIGPFAQNVFPVALDVGLVTSEETFQEGIKVTTPTISPRSGAAPQLMTLACGTSGAAIYYTIDGSYPRSGNPSAILYTAPFNVLAAATVRAGAFKSGLIDSDINAVEIT